MWFIFQGSIIFGAFCWIGQYVDYIAEPETKRAAGMAGGIVAYVATFAVVYAADFCRRALRLTERP